VQLGGHVGSQNSAKEGHKGSSGYRRKMASVHYPRAGTESCEEGSVLRQGQTAAAAAV
jgi:hypothetical protein